MVEEDERREAEEEPPMHLQVICTAMRTVEVERLATATARAARRQCTSAPHRRTTSGLARFFFFSAG